MPDKYLNDSERPEVHPPVHSSSIGVSGLKNEDAREQKYTFGFLLATTVGNMTHYVNLRKYTERDRSIRSIWAPVSHYTPPSLHSRLRFLPPSLFLRARVLQQSLPVLQSLGHVDAVMVHLFEGEILCSLRSYFSKHPILISSTDEAPIVDRSNYPLYPQHLNKPIWRQKFRLALDRWVIGRFDHFIPFSSWVANILIDSCGESRENVTPIHVGVDLELWQSKPKAKLEVGTLPKILFVGGDFVRKGGRLLLDVFEKRFQGRAELHLVSGQAPTQLPPNVYAHRDMVPNDPRMIALYARSDMLVVPTQADFGPWVFFEAMAMRLPIVGTSMGSIPEQIIDGETGYLVDVDNAASVGSAVEKLLLDEPLRLAMGERGRALVEQRYNAAINVPLILQTMKNVVDRSRSTRPSRR